MGCFEVKEFWNEEKESMKFYEVLWKVMCKWAGKRSSRFRQNLGLNSKI